MSEMSQAVRIAQLAAAAVAMHAQADGATEPLDYLAVTSLAFASTQPDDAWSAVEASPVPESSLACLEEIGQLINDWPGDLCDTHPDWTGFYRSFLTALTQARRDAA